HARDLDVPRDLERLHVAAHRAERRGALDAARRAREPLGRARAGHRADDGGLRAHDPARHARVPVPPALLHPGHHAGKREGMKAGVLLRQAAVIAVLAGAAACAPRGGTAPAAAPAAWQLLDDFESPDRWTAHPSDGVELRITTDAGRTGRALRLDFDFRGGSGYAIARRELPLELPENYEFVFWLRADAPVNDLEFKLVDPTGENVWWVNRRKFEYPREWTRIVVKKRHIEFAWGPVGGGDPERFGALERVVTAAPGGRGTVWVDDLAFRELDPPAPYTLTPVAAASGFGGAAAPALVLDGDPATVWRSAGGDTAWLTLDF